MGDSLDVQIVCRAPRNLQVTVTDDVAWATYLIDATLTSASESGSSFLRSTMGSDDADQTEWEQSFAESCGSSQDRWSLSDHARPYHGTAAGIGPHAGRNSATETPGLFQRDHLTRDLGPLSLMAGWEWSSRWEAVRDAMEENPE